MKLHLLFSILVLSFFGCNNDDINDKNRRNENWAWWVDTKTEKGHWIRVEDKTTVDNGRYTLFYFNGNVYETGKMDKGIKVDTIFGYSIDGQLHSYKVMPDSSWFYINDGTVKLYYANGDILAEGIIQNHKRGDRWIQYHENGNLDIVENFVRDTGWSVNYFENGAIMDSIFHVKGLRDFTIKSWYINGQVKESNEYKDGNFNGIHKRYYPNGQLQDSGIMVQGKYHGVGFIWFENGQLKALSNYRDGKLNGVSTTYHENGRIKTIGSVADGILSGEVKQYDENGKLIASYLYKDGILIE